MEINTNHVKGWEGSLTFGLDGILHAVGGVFQDALHGLAGSNGEHLTQVVKLPEFEETRDSF